RSGPYTAVRRVPSTTRSRRHTRSPASAAAASSMASRRTVEPSLRPLLALVAGRAGGEPSSGEPGERDQRRGNLGGHVDAGEPGRPDEHGHGGARGAPDGDAPLGAAP